MRTLIILTVGVLASGCTWTRPIVPQPDQRVDARVERADRRAEAERRCQAAANRGADRDYDRDAAQCPREH